MTENLDWFSQVDGVKEHGAESTPSLEQILTLQLPPDLALALQERCRQLGQTQTEVILALLRSAMQLTSASSSQSVNPSESTANQLATLQEVR
jgi:ABC-type Fe3+-hydroxamate transport system substrate-binding protein